MEIGICRRCCCNSFAPCYDEEKGKCSWIDREKTLCSHCFYGFNADVFQTKAFYRPGYDWLERDSEFAKSSLRNPKSHWVYDIERDGLCVVQMGDHIGAVRILAKEFYGLTRIKREEIFKWQE